MTVAGNPRPDPAYTFTCVVLSLNKQSFVDRPLYIALGGNRRRRRRVYFPVPRKST